MLRGEELCSRQYCFSHVQPRLSCILGMVRFLCQRPCRSTLLVLIWDIFPPPAQWFYRFHLVCFLGFMVLACMHYSGSWRYFTPGERHDSECGT